jgi:hypothetical protein
VTAARGGQRLAESADSRYVVGDMRSAVHRPRRARNGVLRHFVLGPLARIALLFGFLVGTFAPARATAREAEPENEVVEECGERGEAEAAHVRTAAREHSRRHHAGAAAMQVAFARPATRFPAPRPPAWVRPQVRLPRPAAPPDEDVRG